MYYCVYDCIIGSPVQDILAKIVILDFIYMQQITLKRELFQGQSAKKSLQALKLLYNAPGPIFLNEWCRQVPSARTRTYARTTHARTRAH